MSRPVGSRFHISGTLVAETPIHVGGIEGNPATDLPLSVNGLGQLYIPGTSLAGPLRHWLIDAFGNPRVEAFWGCVPGKVSNSTGRASFVSIEDARIGSHGSTEIRDGVGIDREFGTAADGIKFDREILPKGTIVDLSIVYDRPPDGSGAAELRAVLEALSKGDIRVGAAKTRGLGKVKLAEKAAWQVEAFDLHTQHGVLALLDRPKIGNSDGYTRGGLEVLAATASARAPSPKLTVTIGWNPASPVMVRASAEGAEIDVMPLVTGVGGGNVAPVISGSSVKGAIRSHAERILATVVGVGVDRRDQSSVRFINQLHQHSLIEALFGAVKKRDETNNAAPDRLGLGALGIDDCLARTKLPMSDWTALADKGTPSASLSRDVAMHVAIDRWTGAAAKSLLFSAAEPWGLVWPPIVIEIDVNRLLRACGDNERDCQAALALLLLTLKDMAEGYVPIGFGVNRGYGDVTVEAITFGATDSGAMQWLIALQSTKITQIGLKASIEPSAAIKPLDEAWRAYLKPPMHLPEAEQPTEGSRE